MASDVWKEFDSNEISHSVAHHLAAIHELMGDQGYARVSDVARALEITRGSASLTLKALKERGLVEEDHNKFLKLSDNGRQIVDSILAKRAIVRKFLSDVLKLDAHQAEVDACKVEHLLSMRTGEQLLQFVQFLLSNDPVAKQFLAEFWVKLGEDKDRNWPIQDVEQLLNSESQ
ncbi:MAG: metal-dependent transcriptional regulator [Candidatus Latescibacteria bacterium]|nr:metal-dependent transcriptional regulator [Candidatus Latescibacterota bacterium]